MIRETILTTRNPAGRVHIAPMGVHPVPGGLAILPFRPSTTLDNLAATGRAVVNYCDDVRVYAGCLTGRRDWPLMECAQGTGARLASALAHAELRVIGVDEDPKRPRYTCRVLHEQTHAPFRGYNRAQFAVLEAAILVSRLHLLPADRIDREIDYLRIAVDKTAGPAEREAWDWLMEAIAAHRSAQPARDAAP